jgi:hypothetical protein
MIDTGRDRADRSVSRDDARTRGTRARDVTNTSSSSSFTTTDDVDDDDDDDTALARACDGRHADTDGSSARERVFGIFQPPRRIIHHDRSSVCDDDDDER